MNVRIEVDPAETEVEAAVADTPSGVRILEARIDRVVLQMDLHTWNLLAIEVRNAAKNPIRK